MTKPSFIPALLLCFLGSLSFFTLANEKTTPPADELTFYATNFSPANYIEHGRLKGVSVELLHLIWKKLGEEKKDINFIPWARAYRKTLHTKNSAFLILQRTPGREKIFKWIGPVYPSENVLLGKKSFTKEISSLEDAYPYTIAVLRDSVAEEYFNKTNFPKENIHLVTSVQQGVVLLKNNRIDFVCLAKDAINTLLKKNNLSTQNFNVAYSINYMDNYIAVNINTPDSLIEKYQSTLASLNDERLNLLKKYKIID